MQRQPPYTKQHKKLLRVEERVHHHMGERVHRAVGAGDAERARAARSLALRPRHRHDGNVQLVDRLPQSQPPQQLRALERHRGHRHTLRTNEQRHRSTNMDFNGVTGFAVLLQVQDRILMYNHLFINKIMHISILTFKSKSKLFIDSFKKNTDNLSLTDNLTNKKLMSLRKITKFSKNKPDE